MTTTSDPTETAHIGKHLHVAPDPSAEATLTRLLDLAGRMRYVVVPHREWHELLAASQEASAFLQAANAEASRLRHALEEIAERSHDVRSFEQSARLAGIHEYATATLDPTIERIIDGGDR